MKEFIQSRKFKIAAGILGSVTIILAVFIIGVGVGLRKAHFSYRFGENYERNFLGSRSMPDGPMGGPRFFFREFGGRDFRNAHGLAGSIISITETNLVIKDRDSKENTVAVTDKTVIKKGRDDVKINDLKNDEKIVVLGRPGENGVIEAELIRVFNDK